MCANECICDIQFLFGRSQNTYCLFKQLYFGVFRSRCERIEQREQVKRRNRKADVVRVLGDRDVHANQLALVIQHRTARVARIERSVGLSRHITMHMHTHKITIQTDYGVYTNDRWWLIDSMRAHWQTQTVPAYLKQTVLAATDDAFGELETVHAERMAERDDALADEHLVRVAERDRRRVGAVADLEHAEVDVEAHAAHHSIEALLARLWRRDPHLGGALDHVRVRNDELVAALDELFARVRRLQIDKETGSNRLHVIIEANM